MDVRRAEDILNSTGVINVLYNGSPIWIESVNRANSMAHVKNLTTKETINVHVSNLDEV